MYTSGLQAIRKRNIPVSYTHLDVYKRQGEEYIALVAGADGKEALYSAMTELINKAK